MLTTGDEPGIGIQHAYKTYLAKLFQLTGSYTLIAAKCAAIVYSIDKQPASSRRTNIELRNVNANYNNMAVSTHAKQHPHIGWQNVLNDLGAKTASIDVVTCLL